MTVVFAQGMRRSGTTILYDALFGDPRFTCWYEPLNRARKAPGGGSRARAIDHMASVVAFRERFLAQRGDATLDQDSLNWGAPRAPDLELEPGWPPHVRDLVAALAEAGDPTLVKFTRASHHVGALAEIRPDAFFVHIVRDPRAVTQSHLFRRLPETRERILREGTFFTLDDDYDQWRAQMMAQHLIDTDASLAGMNEEPGFVKVLLLWKTLYERTRDDAAAHFAERHVVVQHERLCEDPQGVLTALYERLELRLPWRVKRWAKRNVRPSKPPHEPDHPEWARAYELLGLTELVDEVQRSAI